MLCLMNLKLLIFGNALLMCENSNFSVFFSGWCNVGYIHFM